MMIEISRAIYESPTVTALGPHLAALLSGYAVIVLGELHITPLGELYLDSLVAQEELQ